MEEQKLPRAIETPQITVGISTYNRKDYLREALNSLKRQTFRDFEVIVVDDGSTDGTGEMIREEFPDVHYLFQENQGDASAKNKAAAHARGRYLVFLDSDDLFLPDALENLLAPLAEDPNGCSYGQYIRIDSAGNKLPTKPKMKVFPSGKILPDLIAHIIVHNFGTLMPLPLFRELGGYDATLQCSYDWKLALELSLKTNLHAVTPPVVLRRRHSSNLSSPNYEKTSLLLKVLNDFLERHPETMKTYASVVRKRLATLYGKLAWEAKKESRSRETIRTHLKAALREAFSFKLLFRYLSTFWGG